MSTGNDNTTSHAWHENNPYIPAPAPAPAPGQLEQSTSQSRNVDIDVNLPKDDILNIHMHTNTRKGEDQSNPNTEALTANTIDIGLTRTESPLPLHPLDDPLSSPEISSRGNTQNSDAISEYDSRTKAPMPDHVPTPERRRSPSPGSPANSLPPGPVHHSRSSGTRSRRSERSPSYPPANRADASNPYSGMGLYATPQFYASPLPIPPMMPPVDYAYANPSAQTPRTNAHSLSAIPSNIPTSTGWGSGWGQPSFPPQILPMSSASANIVAAAATPEWKGTTPIIDLKTMTEPGSFAESNPYRRRSSSRKSTFEYEPDHRLGPYGGSFQSSPYYSTSEARPTSQHSPWPQGNPWLQSSPWPPYPSSGAQWNAASVQSARHGAQGSSNTYQPHTSTSSYFGASPYADPWSTGYPPFGASYAPDRRESYSARSSALPNYSQYGNSSSRLPGRSESGPRRRMTSADIVSAAANAPTSEKARRQRANSFLTHDPYPSSTSAPRRNTLSPTRPDTRTSEWSSHNPYRLSSPSRRDSTVPGSGWDSGWGSDWGPSEAQRPVDEPSRRRRSSRRESYADSDYDGYDDYGYDRRTADRYRRGSRHRRRSQSPDYSRRRRRQQSLSPSYYNRPPYVYPGYGPPTIPYPPYPGPGSASYDSVATVMKHHRASSRPHSLYRQPGFWHRVGSFFKSPFERGRPTITTSPRTSSTKTGPLFFVEVIIGQVYFHILLRLPSLYFSRVSRIFDESNLNLVEITEMVFQTAGASDSNKQNAAVVALHAPSPSPEIRPQYERLKSSWEAFIDALIREWETFNIVSVMLLTAILTILQINTAAGDPVTRYTALFSLICAMVSLLFGCMYIIRFGTMRKTYAAAEWAKSAINASQSDLWNVWVLLSMPVVWLAWSILLFIASIMSFVWRTTPDSDDPSTLILSARTILAIRIVMSALLGLGLVNTVLITNTFRQYGEALDEDWKIWIKEWKAARAVETQNPNMIDYGKPPVVPSYPPFFNSSQNVPPPKAEPPYPPFTYTPLTPFSPPLPSPPSSPWNNISIPVQTLPNFPVKSAMKKKKPQFGLTPVSNSGPTYGTYVPTNVYIDGESDATVSSSTDSSRSRRRRRRRSRSPSRSSPDSIHRSSGRANDRRTRRSHRNRRSSTQSSQTPAPMPPTVMANNPPISRPANDPVHHSDRQGDGPYQVPHSPNDGDETDAYDEGNRVRFRSPLESAREATNSGGSEWGAYDSSFDNPNSPRVIGPSSSSASGLTALSESSNVHIQNSDALRQRRRPP